MPNSFNGLRVTTFENRRAAELGALIERQGGKVRSAPAMRELPDPSAPDAAIFAEQLMGDGFDMAIFLTGVGAQALMTIIEQSHSRDEIISKLSAITTVCRGPKPTATLRDWKIKPNIVAAMPNTWHEIIEALDADGSIEGKRIAIQEYGMPNEALAAALRERGADVTSVTVYAWALPEDLTPLQEAITAAINGETDIAVFTTAQQVRNMLTVAAEMKVEAELRTALRKMAIASVGPTTTEGLKECGLNADFEPDRVKMGDLVRELSRAADLILSRKRASAEAGLDTHTISRLEFVWPKEFLDDQSTKLHDSAFLKACRREKTPYTPVWLMRQAGRYQRFYRQLRSKVSFLELCKTPELAAQVTVEAVDQLKVDAAIIFSDILLIVEEMGVGLSFTAGDGPQISNPVREGKDVDRIQTVDPNALSYVYDAIRLTRRALQPDVPLIGFCGAPFTVASYMIEGGHSRNFRHTKMLMYSDPGAWHALLDRIAISSVAYLNYQIAAGVQAIQIFDSWVGCLSDEDYRQFVLPHMRSMIARIHPGTPIIYFGTDTTVMLKSMKEAGIDVIGLDWRVNLTKTWEELGHDVAVQGNLDPMTLFASPSEITKRAKAILDQVDGRPGHIFNLGHGILPETPVDHVLALIDAIHEHSSR